MLKQVPYVGQIVLFKSNLDDVIAKSNHNDDYIPAIITRKWSNYVVNLKIIPDCGSMQDRTSVSIIDHNPAGYHFKFIEAFAEVEQVYSEAELVSFGNYLLSIERDERTQVHKHEVTHADMCNWIEEH